MTKRVKVVKSDPPESTEILAEAIVSIGRASERLLSSGINKRAVIVLLQDITKLPKGNIKIVLDSLPQLERWYCKPK